MKAIRAFALRAAPLWQLAPGKLLRGQKIAGSNFSSRSDPQGEAQGSA